MPEHVIIKLMQFKLLSVYGIEVWLHTDSCPSHLNMRTWWPELWFLLGIKSSSMTQCSMVLILNGAQDKV